MLAVPIRTVYASFALNMHRVILTWMCVLESVVRPHIPNITIDEVKPHYVYHDVYSS
jgi:hypothetical protein